METHRKFKLEQNAIRVYVIFIGLMLTIYCGLLCFGIRHFLAEFVCLTGAYLVLCGGAWMFRLCWLSWAFIIYTYAVRLCIMLYGEGYWVGDGLCGLSLLETAHCIAFGVGAILSGIFMIRFKHYWHIIKSARNE